MTTCTRELVLKGAKADLARLADFIESACDEAHVASTARFDLQLAVEEAYSNVIEHAYRGKGGEVRVCFETLERDVVITIHDHGRPFDPSKVASPDFGVPLEKRPIGGLGLFLIYRLADDVRFQFGPKGNTLVMVKRNVLQGPPPGQPESDAGPVAAPGGEPEGG